MARPVLATLAGTVLWLQATIDPVIDDAKFAAAMVLLGTGTGLLASQAGFLATPGLPSARGGGTQPRGSTAPSDAPGATRRARREAAMNRTDRDMPPPRGAEHRAHAHYTGGVYGSMLAASVIVGAGDLGSYPHTELVLLLLFTGVVFWAAHVHAQLFGARLAQRNLDRRAVLHVLRDEWPIVNAAVPPAVAVAASPLLGLGVEGSLWLALAVAVAGQVGWSVAAARRAGASRSVMAVTGSVNLLLGLLIILFKLLLTH